MVVRRVNVSLLVPWRPDSSPARAEAWNWLKARWTALLPVELVEGTCEGEPFSKTQAVNDAYLKSSGDVLIVADADSWMAPEGLEKAVEAANRLGRLVMPWHTAWRLSEADSQEILKMSPKQEPILPGGFRDRCTDYQPSAATIAMIYVIRRDAFERVGGMDPRFRGWGSEDVCFGLACRTMLGPVKVLLGEAYSFWHPRSRTKEGARVWDSDSGRLNRKLARAYRGATGHPEKMQALCAEHAFEGKPVEAIPGVKGEPLVREFLSPGEPGSRVAL